ncbi:uncharacterized protein [Phyllobates terribilis]|uniref:uncharacterized protein n=1 Tax=Phyllobates terribilis TaxID=111132 RepID=UPI003CCA71F5
MAITLEYLRQILQQATLQEKKVSAVDFNAYRIMTRFAEENHILKCKHLFHQFIVDMYAKIESERLLYIRLNQKKLRAEEYIHLRDAVANDADPKELGKMVILLSTVTGSPRHMHEYTQDAMTYVRKYGRPDLFITFTCNPAWEEIGGHLLPGQKTVNRHDLIARVFKRKLSKMTKLITKSHIYGETQCWMYSVEWQKRGLPHAHILIWLKQKIQPTEIDNIISAELPDPQIDPLLFDTISKNMIHGPCGSLNKNSPCMIDGRCSKHYPRSLVQETQTGQDGYPVYRRRKPGDGGFIAKLKMRVGSSLQEIEIDNRWVVPYNPLVSKIFQAHINVESCHSVKSIKYICKYVHKGSDQACIAMSGKALQLLGLPAPIRNPEGIQMCREIFLETNYNIDELTAFVSQNEPILVPDQRDAYNYILSFSETNKGGIVFIDAPGGTGKTFVINLLLAKFRQQKKIALAVASSGIAATLLKGGRTAHSTFKLPLNLSHSDSPVCNIAKAPKNDSVNKINLQILNLLPGVCTTYKSVDTVIDPAQVLFYPTEFLNSLEPQGLPLHNLFLKPGAPIWLLRNLDPPKLCNGTRLLIKNLFPHVIEATILTGCATGEDVFIPTIPLIPSDLPFDFKRLQFPVRLAFPMSINKAQGQSLKVVGIDLQSPCFSHGQLYVACSRVGTA